MASSISSSDARGEGLLVLEFNIGDGLSRLSNDLLAKIISKLSTVEAVRTCILSKRWKDVWKEISHLSLDMKYFTRPRNPLSDVISYAGRSMTKVIEDHKGHLERCVIYHDSHQCEEGMIEAWIQSLVHVKHTKHLTLVNFISPFNPNTRYNITLHLPPTSFSHSNLESLHLCQYTLRDPHGFNNSWNLKTMKLIGLFAEIAIFNALIRSCPSLEVLVLDITCPKKSVPLKIENRNLKFLSLSCSKIVGVEVTSPNIDILIVGYRSLSFYEDKCFIANRSIKFNRNFWTTGQIFGHTSYNISYQEGKNIAHEFMMSESNEHMKRFASMSVSVDLKNKKEVDMLQEVLVAWPHQEMAELEIVFKNSNVDPMKEGESSTGRTQKNFWEETKPFPNEYFCAYTVWLFNFSGSEEEFALASRFITQGTVGRTLVIKPSSTSQSNKLEIEEAVAKLKELPKGHEYLHIECSYEHEWFQTSHW